MHATGLAAQHGGLNLTVLGDCLRAERLGHSRKIGFVHHAPYGTSPLGWAWPTLWASPDSANGSVRYLCMPKSGSSSLRHAVDQASGVRARRLTVYFGLRYSANGSAPSKENRDMSTPVARRAAAVARLLEGGKRAAIARRSSEEWRTALPFTFVRDPLERARSQYLYYCRNLGPECVLSKEPGRRAFDAWLSRWAAVVPSFEDGRNTDAALWWPFIDEHYSPQWRLILNAAAEAEAAGWAFEAPFRFVGRLSREHAPADWAALLSLLKRHSVPLASSFPEGLARAREARGEPKGTARTKSAAAGARRASAGTGKETTSGSGARGAGSMNASAVADLLSASTLRQFCAVMRAEYACLGFELPRSCRA